VGKEAKQTNYVCLNLFAFGPTQIEPPAPPWNNNHKNWIDFDCCSKMKQIN
jgi:hypothetical protein